MYRFLIAIFLSVASSYGYNDSDMDGVEDAYDRCPQTFFSDLVNQDGCPVQSTGRLIHYDLILGIDYSQVNYASQEPLNTATTSLEINGYIDRWLVQGVLAYYSSANDIYSQQGADDTSVNILYRFTPTEILTITTGAGIILPTYKSGYHNEATDYSAMANFQYGANSDLTLLSGLNYTWIMDKNIQNIRYQNTIGLYFGISYLTDSQSSLSAIYRYNESMFGHVEAIETVGLDYFYQINSHWSFHTDYRYGLSDSASTHSLAGYIGYSF